MEMRSLLECLNRPRLRELAGLLDIPAASKMKVPQLLRVLSKVDRSLE